MNGRSVYKNKVTGRGSQSSSTFYQFSAFARLAHVKQFGNRKVAGRVGGDKKDTNDGRTAAAALTLWRWFILSYFKCFSTRGGQASKKNISRWFIKRIRSKSSSTAEGRIQSIPQRFTIKTRRNVLSTGELILCLEWLIKQKFQSESRNVRKWMIVYVMFLGIRKMQNFFGHLLFLYLSPCRIVFPSQWRYTM